mmetsp:Transcript_55980/g.67196  ORF Transcript_55980/g.67196 Transcript_55980/m.67196 type:complete len:165 (+) Transcript_55980:311-805(+)
MQVCRYIQLLATALLSRILLLLPIGSIVVIVRGQQAPAFSTKIWDENVTHRTNVCERQLLVYNDELLLPKALKGLDISVITTNHNDAEGFFSLNSDGVIDPSSPQIFTVIMDEVANRGGFSWRKSYTAFSSKEVENGNKTWTDFLFWGADGTHVKRSSFSRRLL